MLVLILEAMAVEQLNHQAEQVLIIVIAIVAQEIVIWVIGVPAHLLVVVEEINHLFMRNMMLVVVVRLQPLSHVILDAVVIMVVKALEHIKDTMTVIIQLLGRFIILQIAIVQKEVVLVVVMIVFAMMAIVV